MVVGRPATDRVMYRRGFVEHRLVGIVCCGEGVVLIFLGRVVIPFCLISAMILMEVCQIA